MLRKLCMELISPTDNHEDHLHMHHLCSILERFFFVECLQYEKYQKSGVSLNTSHKQTMISARVTTNNHNNNKTNTKQTNKTNESIKNAYSLHSSTSMQNRRYTTCIFRLIFFYSVTNTQLTHIIPCSLHLLQPICNFIQTK